MTNGTTLKSVGLALGMGGARGFAHVGVLRELEAMGITVDRVAGCSMGALIGAAWAAGRLEAFEDWANGLTRTKFLGYLDISLSGGGLVAGREIANLMDRLEIPENIEDLEKPFTCVATDLANGREVWFDRGPVREAVRASVSIPGVITPYRIDGMWLVDGALVDPVPVSGVRRLGSGPVIAVDPNSYGPGGFWTPPEPSASVSGNMLSTLWQRSASLGGWLSGSNLEAAQPPAEPDPTPPNYMDVIWGASDITLASVMRMRLAASPPDFLLEVPLRDLSVLDFGEAKHAMQTGRAALRAEADAVRALVS